MGQMSAGIIVQAKDTLVAKHVAQVVPVLFLHLARVGLAELLHRRHLDTGVQDGPVGAQVGVGTAMRLDVGMLRPEQLASLLVGKSLDGVDIVASGIESVIWKSLAVLVGQQVSHGCLHGKGGEILAGDQLQVGALVCKLLDDPSCDKWRYLGDFFQRRNIGNHSRVDWLPALQIAMQCIHAIHLRYRVGPIVPQAFVRVNAPDCALGSRHRIFSGEGKCV